MASLSSLFDPTAPDEAAVKTYAAALPQPPQRSMFGQMYDFLSSSDTAEAARKVVAGMDPKFSARGMGMMAAVPPVVAGSALGSIYRSATLPGDVYTGKVNPWSEEGLGRATEMAGTLGVGGSVMPKPAGSVGIFGGRLAKTADLGLRDEAAASHSLQGMSGFEDVTPESIYKDTGWFKGKDDQLRFEIPDNMSSIKGYNGQTVGDILHHPLLYKAYPDVAKIPVTLYDSSRFGGMYRAGGVMPEEYRGLSGDAGLPIKPGVNERIELSSTSAIDTEEHKSILLHELQHAIQAREGFSGGATPETVGLDQYRRTAGEVEARNVQSRADMTDRDALPWATQDVPFDQQVVYPRERGEDYQEWKKRQTPPRLSR